MPRATDNLPARKIAALLALAATAGCTTMASIPPGTPLAEVESQYGRPNFSCPLPDGGQRAIWTQQPLGQYAWASDVGPDGRTNGVQAILTDAYFERLREGTWTAGQVQCAFGPPALVREVGLPSVRQVVWSYRYKQSGVWNSLMHVYMGRDGDRVTRFHPGPDPMYDDERWPGI